MSKIKIFLSKPTDISSLVFLRVSFGLLMLWELSRFFVYGWVDELYIQQVFHFKYEWFSWVEPLPGPGMYVVFGLLWICSILIAIGLFYQMAITMFFGLYTYIFLIDQAYYNNHFYLIGIFSFLMIFTPLNHAWSSDCRRGATKHLDHLPAFWLWLMRFPMSMVYVYGAIAKMESDWLSGKSTEALLGIANEGTFLEPLMNLSWIPFFYAWSGMLFDLLIPFAVLWRKTRIPAFMAAIFFHTHNFFVFPIGVFPLLSLALTLLYFDPDFPKKLIPKSAKQFFLRNYKTRVPTSHQGQSLPSKNIVKFLMLFLICQMIIPFRHHLYPGETNWHEEGHYFAWRMMLRQKVVEMRYDITHPTTGETRYAPPEDYLNPSQIRSFAGNPGMNLQFAHHLRKLVIRNAGFTPVVTAQILVSLNGRDPKKLVDENLDLGKIPKFRPAYLWVQKFE